MSRSRAFAWSVAVALLAAACGGGGSGQSTTGNPVTGPTPAATPGASCEEFDSTFAAIQKVVFENHGCTQAVCHGSAASGGLDLRPEVAYANLIEAPSTGSPNPRVMPGEPGESFLLAKLAAATRPGSVAISGSPMPSGLPPISENELEAIRLWIEGGAPATGAVGDQSTGSSGGIGELLDACLPPAGPITIEPLKPPAKGEGVQFQMPTYLLPASTELEICFASYYDIGDAVPAEFQDPARGVFFMNGSRLRQDPQSHHFVMTHSGLDASWVHDPSYGAWACRGGARAGASCEPTDRTSCGDDGLCASEVKNSIACIGFGPPEGAVDVASGGIAGAQTAQQYVQPRDGVYREIPLRGLLYWNSHAFNLTPEDHSMNGRVNLFYAAERRYRSQLATDSAHVYIAAGQAPFTIESYCADHVVPQGVQVISIGSHTHKRGKRFWVELGGEQIYESLNYSDPVEVQYDPPLRFDDPAPAARTLRYCATYNNGVAADGSPDPRTVTRASRMPDRASCRPVACTAGKVGAACSGVDDDATCDSAPGAGDGECDACPITAGVTTENEMFILTPTYILPEE